MKDFNYYKDIKSPYYTRSDFYITTRATGGKVFAKRIGNGQICYAGGGEYPLDEVDVLRAMKKVVEKDSAAFESAFNPYRDERGHCF